MDNWVYRFLQALFLVTLIGTTVAAAAETAQPAFEAASVRPSHLTNGCFSMLPPGGTHFELSCMTLRNLIDMAYKTSYVDGGGSALEAYYDLRATTPDGEAWTMESVRPMLQQLLAERFHLVVRAGKREIAGYGLVVAKGGAKLHAVDARSVVQGQRAGEPSQNFVYPGQIQGRGADMAGVASLLSVVTHVPVVDRTGIAGVFDVDVRYAPDGSTNSNLPSLFSAVEEQLGLRLKPEKVMVDVEHADAAPTAN